MKRYTVMALCLVLSLCQLTGCGDQAAKATAAPAAEEKSALQTAFEEGKTFSLVKADLPKEGEALGGMPVSVSPDGSTWLWIGQDYQLHIIRDTRALPVSLAPDRGAGDLRGNLEYIMNNLTKKGFPCPEGVSWSPDGRYAALSYLRAGDIMRAAMDLILLDAENGEAFLAVAYELFPNENNGNVLLSAFDRKGEYVYFVLSKMNGTQRTAGLARYSLESGNSEWLCDLPGTPGIPGMYETADGGWTVFSSDRDVGWVCFVETDESGQWRVKTPLAVSRPFVANLYLHAAYSGFSLLDGYDLNQATKNSILYVTAEGKTQEETTLYAFGWGCVSPDGRLVLLDQQESVNGTVNAPHHYLLLDPATMQTAEVNVPASLSEHILVRKTSGMEWHGGDLILIDNYETRALEAWRLTWQ